MCRLYKDAPNHIIDVAEGAMYFKSPKTRRRFEVYITPVIRHLMITSEIKPSLSARLASGFPSTCPFFRPMYVV